MPSLDDDSPEISGQRPSTSDAPALGGEVALLYLVEELNPALGIERNDKAFAALTRIGSQQVRDLLYESAVDPKRPARYHTVRALAALLELDDLRAHPIALGLMSDPLWARLAPALNAYIMRHDWLYDTLFDRLVNAVLSGRYWTLRTEGFPRVLAGPETTKRLQELAQGDYSIEERATFLRVMGHLGDESIVPALLAIASDASNESYLRSSAVWALRNLEAKSAAPGLIELLANTDDWRVRRAAGMTLQVTRRREDGPALAALLDHPHKGVRVQAMRVLTSRRMRTYLPAIAERLNDSDAGVRMTALKCLDRFHAEETYFESILSLILADSSEKVRLAALRLLQSHVFWFSTERQARFRAAMQQLAEQAQATQDPVLLGLANRLTGRERRR